MAPRLVRGERDSDTPEYLAHKGVGYIIQYMRMRHISRMLCTIHRNGVITVWGDDVAPRAKRPMLPEWLASGLARIQDRLSALEQKLGGVNG